PHRRSEGEERDSGAEPGTPVASARDRRAGSVHAPLRQLSEDRDGGSFPGRSSGSGGLDASRHGTGRPSREPLADRGVVHRRRIELSRDSLAREHRLTRDRGRSGGTDPGAAALAGLSASGNGGAGAPSPPARPGPHPPTP